LLVAHLQGMQAWLDLIDEVIVVDSRSTAARRTERWS